MRTSVILCVRNGEQTLLQQLDALASQDMPDPWELLLVDNGSTDRTRDVFLGWAERVAAPSARLVDAAHVTGLSAARNAGVGMAAGDTLLFCDADDVVGLGWVRNLSDALATADLVGGALLLDGLNREQVRSWRAGFFEAPAEGLPEFGVPYVVGANFGMTRITFDLLGGFDEAFVICSDDVDISVRAHLAGLRVAFAPDAQVQYRFRDTLPELGRQMRNYGRGVAAVRLKHRQALDLPPLNLRDERREAGMLVRLALKYRALDEDQRAYWVQLANYKAGFWSETARARIRPITSR